MRVELDRVQRLAGHSGKLLINCRPLKYLSDNIIAEFLRLSKQCKIGGTQLVVSDLSPQLANVFRVLHLDLVLVMHDDEHSALSLLGQVGPTSGPPT